MAGEKDITGFLDKLLRQDKLLWVRLTQQNLEVQCPHFHWYPSMYPPFNFQDPISSQSMLSI